MTIQILFPLFWIFIGYLIKDAKCNTLIPGEITYANITQDNNELKIDESITKDITASIFSANCNLYISSQNNIKHSVNNDSFLIKISPSEINDTIQFKPLNEDFQEGRDCQLIINTMYDEEKKLIFTGNGQTVFFFDEEMSQTEITYDYTKDNYVTFSFLFNDIATFNIKIFLGTEKIREKTVSSSINIFLTSELSNKDNNNLIIKITKLEGNDNPVLMKFGVFTNNITPLILQKNYLNYGFTTSNSQYLYYYMDIFKDEVGEIVLHDKRQNGIIIGKICKKEDCSFKNLSYYPINEEKYKGLHYKQYNFDLSQTNDCDEGCNLLITYKHEINNSTDDQDIIVGYEFTLLPRIWSRQNIQPQLVNIPYNEYIFGQFDLTPVKCHYYSIFVSNETDIIGFEAKGKYFKVFMEEGQKKVDIMNSYTSVELAIDNYKDYIEINVEDNNYKNKYLSFAVTSNDIFQKMNSSYYFRITQRKSTDYLIIPLDSNIANIIRPLSEDDEDPVYFSYFLLKNDYNEFSLSYSIFPSNQNIEFQYRIVKMSRDETNITQNYLNTIIEEEAGEEMDENSPKIIISNDTDNTLGYILVIFRVYNNYIAAISSSFGNTEKEIYPQIYSSGIYQINSVNTIMKFYDLKDYSLTISHIHGEGEIEYFLPTKMKLDKNYKVKQYTQIIQNNTLSIHISNTNNRNSLFILYVELNYFKETNNMGDIMFSEPFSRIIKYNSFPIYSTVDLEEQTLLMNFNIFDFNNRFSNYSLEGMRIYNKSNMKYDISNFKSECNGTFDTDTQLGFLECENKDSIENSSMLIKINPEGAFISDPLVYIFAMNKYGCIYTPINQFILGSIDNSLEESLEYLISCDNDGEKKDVIVIEFNKNNKGLEISFTDLSDIPFNYSKKYLINGMEKYEISEYDDYFKVKINFDNSNKNSPKANYMLRYYFKQENDIIDLVELNETIKDINYDENEKLFTFEFEKMQNSRLILNATKIFYYLYLDNNINELLNTSAIVSTKPIYNDIVSNDNVDNDTFKLKINLNSSSYNKKEYKYIIRIKIIAFNHQDLNVYVYSIPVDLEKYLKTTNWKIIIILGVIIFVVVIILIGTLFLTIKFLKERKKNRNLTEQVLSIKFSSGQELIKVDNSNCEKDKDYETTFI